MASKQELVRQVRGDDPFQRHDALHHLRAKNWLRKGALSGVDLSRLDLSGASLSFADLRKARMHDTNLVGADLIGSDLTDVTGLTYDQMAKARSMVAARIPDGRYYDGRLNLGGDIDDLLTVYAMPYENLDYATEWFGVSHEEFKAGQDWSRVHMPVRYYIGLIISWEDNDKVQHGFEKLREMNAVSDGSLHRICLFGAQLERMDLRDADLRHSNLSYAYLKKADLTGAKLDGADLGNADMQDAVGLGHDQLMKVESLRKAKMPHSELYDGRYVLRNEFAWGRPDPQTLEAEAESYGISVEQYQQGQDWAKHHVPGRVLLKEFCSPDSTASQKALAQLRQRGTQAGTWFQKLPLSFVNWEGVDLRGLNLRESRFFRANLRHTNLGETTLTRADMREVNLEGSNITFEQLRTIDSLRGATMPNGSIYDGRYDLPGDRITYHRQNKQSPISQAEWYGVTLADFLKGQAWAKMNLE